VVRPPTGVERVLVVAFWLDQVRRLEILGQ
jgi:hypothetical protein